MLDTKSILARAEAARGRADQATSFRDYRPRWVDPRWISTDAAQTRWVNGNRRVLIQRYGMRRALAELRELRAKLDLGKG